MFAEQWEQAPLQRVPQASESAPSEIGGKTYNSQAQIRCGMETSRWEESRARSCQDRKPAAASRDTQSLLGTIWVPCISLLPFSNRTLSSQQLWTNVNQCGRSQLLILFHTCLWPPIVTGKWKLNVHVPQPCKTETKFYHMCILLCTLFYNFFYQCNEASVSVLFSCSNYTMHGRIIGDKWTNKLAAWFS